MYEVTCISCHRAVEITPEAATCPACGEELQQLLLPDQVADYFLARVQSLTFADKPAAALAAADRGLKLITSSHLRLLAAILAQRLGRYDQMRRHVAAIPVDDALRGEAEWLLRSHQARGRAPNAPVPADPSPTVAALLGSGGAAAVPAARPALALNALAALLVLTGLATFGWALRNTPLVLVRPQIAGSGPAAAAPAAPQVTALPVVPVVNLLPTPTPTPTPMVAPDMVVAPAQVQTADANPRRVVVIASTALDLPGYLRDVGYPELAELAVSARLQDGVIILQGVVHLDRERRQLIRLMQEMSGVADVNAVDLLVRPLPVYVVQEGDTLWTIVNDIYGNVDRLDEFVVYNRDVLPTPDALTPGMTLKVLPFR